MNCPNCNGKLADAGERHYKCLRCQKRFVQMIAGNAKVDTSELIEIREVGPELIPEEIEE